VCDELPAESEQYFMQQTPNGKVGHLEVRNLYGLQMCMARPLICHRLHVFFVPDRFLLADALFELLMRGVALFKALTVRGFR